MEAPRPKNESERLATLRSLAILDSAPEQDFDDLVRIAAHVCAAPIALMTLVDDERQWFKARVGLEVTETPRREAFCAYAILSDEPLVVPDARDDERFRDNALVTGSPHIRFYAGAPLRVANGASLGTICVIDTEPRAQDSLTDAQLDVLETLSRQAIRLIKYRKDAGQGQRDEQRVTPVPVCAWCTRIRSSDGSWASVSAYLSQDLGLETTHGMCPRCLAGSGTKGSA